LIFHNWDWSGAW